MKKKMKCIRNMNRNAVLALVILFALPVVTYAAATNVSILYGWNGTSFVPVQITSEGAIKMDINMTQTVGINPKINNTYDLGSLSRLWATLYVRSVRGGSGPLSLFAGGNEIITLLANGNVGIGTTNPLQQLTVVGTANITGGVIAPNVTYADGSIQTSASISTNVSLEYGYNGSNFVPLLTTGGGVLRMGVEQANIATATTANSLTAGATGSTLTLSGGLNVTAGGLIVSAGNVGIGTTSPTSSLMINGTFSVVPSASVFSTTGGTITTSEGYIIHTFTTNGTFNVSGSGTVEVLVVAGGGGGGSYYGGGGGGGGVLYNISYPVSTQSYTVIIGTGGSGSTAGNPGGAGTKGSDSVFGSLTSIGGGGGGYNTAAGNSGGSGGGGGGASPGSLGGAGTANQGNAGGTSGGNAGGGGGAGANGTAPDGGVGAAYRISGSTKYYGGGGGGFNYGVGNLGGGGYYGSQGTNNTGGGGGGYSSGAAPNGGSGIVIIRYLNTSSFNADANGRAGIRTTSPAFILDVNGAIRVNKTIEGDNNLTFYGDIHSSTGMILNRAGNVGIGTTNPTSALTISDGSATWVHNPVTNEMLQLRANINNGGNVSILLAGNANGFFITYHEGVGVSTEWIGFLNGFRDMTKGFILDGNGYVGLGTLAAASANHICYDTTTRSGMNTFATCSSLKELKTNIKLQNTALPEIMNLTPVSFQNKKTNETQYGFIAEDVNSVDPVLSTYYQGKLDGVDYDAIVSRMVKGMQEQQTQIEQLKNENNQLKVRIAALERK